MEEKELAGPFSLKMFEETEKAALPDRLLPSAI
jgi:hypothetical protein